MIIWSYNHIKEDNQWSWQNCKYWWQDTQTGAYSGSPTQVKMEKPAEYALRIQSRLLLHEADDADKCCHCGKFIACGTAKSESTRTYSANAITSVWLTIKTSNTPNVSMHLMPHFKMNHIFGQNQNPRPQDIHLTPDNVGCHLINLWSAINNFCSPVRWRLFRA